MADTQIMTKDQATQAMTGPVRNTGTLESLLKGMGKKLSEVIPQTAQKYLTPERIIRTLSLAASRNPQLLECTGLSIMQGVMSAAELGLEVNSPLEHAYLIPRRNNKTQRMEAGLLIGYKGYLELARRTGDIASITVNVVHKGDVFKFNLASSEIPTHEIDLEKDPGAMLAVYCIAHFKDGTHASPVLMRKAEVDKIRAGSQAKNAAAWSEHYEEMAKKTSIRRARKLWPLSTEDQNLLARAEALDVDNDEDSRTAIIATMDEGMASAQAMLDKEAQEKQSEDSPLVQGLQQKAKELAQDAPAPQAHPPATPPQTNRSQTTPEAPPVQGKINTVVSEEEIDAVRELAIKFYGYTEQEAEDFLIEGGIRRKDQRSWTLKRVEWLKKKLEENAQAKDKDENGGEVPLD